MGVLNTQIVELKVGGLDQSVDPKQAPPESLLTAENCQITKTGLVEKRLGFFRVPVTTWDGSSLPGNIRGIFSTGVELCVVDGDALYSYDSAYSRWRTAGFVSPFTGKEYVSARGRVSYDQCDLAARNGHVVYAQFFTYFTAWDDIYEDATHGISASVLTEGGETQIARVDLFSATAVADKPYSVRCVGTGDNNIFIVLYSYKQTADPKMSIGCHYAYSKTDSEFTQNADLYTDLDVQLAAQFVRLYDACSLVGVDYWTLAYINDSQDIIVTVHEAAPPFAETDTATLALSHLWERLAISANSNHIYLLSWYTASKPVVTVFNYSLTEVVASTEITTNAIQKLDNLGITVHTDNGSVETISCTWTEITEPAEAGDTTVKVRYVQSLHNVLANTVNWQWTKTWHNTLSRSKPILPTGYANPVFDCAVDQNPALSNSGDESVLVSCGVVLSAVETGNTVVPSVSDKTRHEIAAIHDVGTAVPGDRNIFSKYLGSANNFVECTDDTVRFATNTLQYSLAGVRDRYGAEEVVLDVLPPVSATKVSVGASVISGGFVSWYDGAFSCELGFISAPHFTFVADNVATASTLADGDYYYQAHWQYFDRYGNLHRSSPGLVSDVATVAGGPDVGVEMSWLHQVPTHRNPVNTSVEVYRASGVTGVFKRISEPLYNVVNDPDANDPVTEIFIDHGQTEADARFTYTEAPPVIPEGASVVQAIGDRLWLAGAFHGEQVLYSKKLYRGTASQAIAAEMNDAFVIKIPNSERVTALGVLNDNLVVFTEKQVYMIAGDGPDDMGNNNSFSALTPIPCDAGCIEPRSVATYPDGIFYQSARGIYHISRNNDITFRGAPVQNFLALYPVVTSAVVVPEKNHVRFTVTDTARTAGTILIYDYLHGTWLGNWNIRYKTNDELQTPMALIPVAACLHNDQYYVVDVTGYIAREGPGTGIPVHQYRDDNTMWVPMKIRSGWVQAAGQSGWQRLRRIVPLGELKKACNVKVSVDYDYSEDYTTEKTFPYSRVKDFDNLPVLSMNVHVPRQKCTAFSVTVEDSEPDDFTSQNGEGITFSGLRFELGVKAGPIKLALVHRS